MSEKRWFTATGACGVPQSSRVSDMSAACTGAASAMNAPAQVPAASMVSIDFIVSSVDASHPGSGSSSPPAGSAADSLEICSRAQRSAGRVVEPVASVSMMAQRLGLMVSCCAVQQSSIDVLLVAPLFLELGDEGDGLVDRSRAMRSGHIDKRALHVLAHGYGAADIDMGAVGDPRP